jgi:hypothetical protein
MNEITPFADDLEFLEQEVAWVTLRSTRLATVKDQAEDAKSTRHRAPTWGKPKNTAEVQVPSNLDAMLAEEQALRDALDARIANTEASGVTLGLQKLVRDHDLDDTDRNTLLLCLVPCVGTHAADPLERAGGYALTGCVCAEVVARFCEFGFRERLTRLRFDAQHKLVQAGLIKGDLDDDASAGEWPTCSIKLTAKGFAALTGLPVLV